MVARVRLIKNEATPHQDLARSFMDFCDRYSRHFIGQGYNSAGHARDYLSGLTGTQRRENIETIEKRKKDIFKFVYFTQPANEISTDGNLTGRESRLILI